LALSVYADFDLVINSVKNISFLFFLSLLSLSFLNYTARFIKWHYYLNILKINVKVQNSFLIFLSGLLMSVTPGKFGEVLKSLILKQHYQQQISRTAPIIIAERITDLISVVLIAAFGSMSYKFGGVVLILTSVFLFALIVILSNKKIFDFIKLRLERFTMLKKQLDKFHNIHESFWTLLSFRNIFLMTFVSLISWFFECFAFYLILSKFDAGITLNLASFIYAFSTLIGSVMLLPGGLGGTEGTMAYLLVKNGFMKEFSVTATILIRIATLWFAVVVGIISFYFYQKLNGKISL
jgi:uncharacterized protein (TIRG00374 family)